MVRSSVAVVATVLLLATSVGPGFAVAAEDITAVDGDTNLATGEGVSTFAEEGVVTGNVSSMQLSVTVAQEAAAVEAPGFHVNQITKFVRVDYDESIPRDVRLHINGSIILPRLSEGKVSLGGNTTADFHVAEGGETQSMTLHLDGQTDAVFAVSTVTGRIQEIRRTVSGAVSSGVENITGWSPPTLGGGQWERVNQTALSGENVSTPLPDSDQLTVQYRSGETWLPVPECQADDPVCTLERNNRTHVVSTTSDGPAVRYKTSKDLMAGLESGWDDLTSVPGDIRDWADDLLGGDG
jgi:hypothetical protein